MEFLQGSQWSHCKYCRKQPVRWPTISIHPVTQSQVEISPHLTLLHTSRQQKGNQITEFTILHAFLKFFAVNASFLKGRYFVLHNCSKNINCFRGIQRSLVIPKMTGIMQWEVSVLGRLSRMVLSIVFPKLKLKPLEILHNHTDERCRKDKKWPETLGHEFPFRMVNSWVFTFVVCRLS